MRISKAIAAGLLFCLFSTSLPAQTIDASGAASVGYAEISGTINPGSSSFIQSAVTQAEQKGLQALIFRMDTPGGLLSSTRDIIRALSDSKIPIVVYVGPGGARATSAGAIIAISAHLVFLAPGTNIGAAAPVGAEGQDIKGDLSKKVKNDTAAMVRAQALVRGRPVDVAEQMVLESKSFSTDEALKLKLVDGLATDLNQLLQVLNGQKVKLAPSAPEQILKTAHLNSDSLVTFKMSRGQALLHFVADPTISTALLALGGMALYAEISSGFTLIVPAIVAAISFLLAFVSLQALPINIGGLLLILVGMAMLVAEAFVTSFGLLAIGGLAALAAGALFLIDTTSADIRVSLVFLLPLLAGIGAVMTTIAILMAREKMRPSGKSDPIFASIPRLMELDESGTNGTLQVAGELWRFRSTKKILQDRPLRVVGKDGLILIIENIEEK